MLCQFFELTPMLFGHSNQLLFQITISLSSVPKEQLTSSVQSASPKKDCAGGAISASVTVADVEEEGTGVSTTRADPAAQNPREAIENEGGGI